ncbi:phage regulatory CII family protein [Alishewanella sp. HL-SH06]|uniref:phage regulatory CII family protein n=1 Tax=Alishewanella sp. HL-SH06 TaxID=3461144 RepID=UPI004042AEE8
MNNNTLKPSGIPHCPQDAAYLLGKRHNASDLARKMGMSVNVLGNKLNPDQEFHKLTLGEAVAITELANDDAILESWANGRGYVLVKVPGQVSCDEELSDQLMKLSEEMGAALGEIRHAREDGIIDPAEYEHIKAKIMATVTEALALKEVVKGQVRDLPRHPTTPIRKGA